MAGYIGQDVAEHFSEFQKQDLTGATGGTLTLSNSVNNANDIELYINHVRQEPTTSYSASGTTITLNGYTVAASDDIYVMYKKAIITHAPSSGSVGAGQIANGSVTGDKLSANLDLQNVTIKGGSNTAMTIDSSGRILTSARPSFIAHNNSTGNVTVSSSNPFPFNTTILNVGSHYNTSTYKFTCPINGLYYFCFQVFGNTGSGTSNAGKSVQIRVNASASSPTIYSRCPDFTNDEYFFNASILNLSANDTVEIYSGDGWTNLYSDNSTNYSRFMGYLIG